MRARARLPLRVVQAFTGREFVSYEWRPVPDGCDAEAKRLEAGGYLELQADSPAAAPASVSTQNIVKVDATRSAISLATEYGLDLATVKGSGAGGRILVADVRRIVFEEEE